MKLVVLTGLALAGEVHAEPAARSDEPTAAEVAHAPRPGDESGRSDTPEGDSLLRNVGQGVLTVPRIAVEAAFAPVRVGIYMYDRYRLSEQFSKTFFDDTDTYGLYPTATIDSTYGVNVGARFVHRNLAGEHEKLALRGTSGGQFRRLFDASLASGTRLGSAVTLRLRGEYEQRPKDPFYGIGNATPAMDLRYRESVYRASSTVDVRATHRLVIRGLGALTDNEVGNSYEGPPLTEQYDPAMLTGWPKIRNLYGEVEVRFDGRRHETVFDRHEIYDSGVLLSAFTGRVHQLEAGHDYWRAGGDAQYFLALGKGPRTLSTRLHAETVSGSYDDVAFTQLPALGGKALLRGYGPGRFRDRAAVVGSLEYFWDLGTLFMASLFVDAGRVYPSVWDLEARDLRMGYGGSLQLHGDHRFIAGLSVASSLDGGLFLSLDFDPIFDYDPRTERR
jgi:hypothetical protein